MARVATHRCPVCSSGSVDKFSPFCSKRCADIDLGRWFSGGYAIPTEEVPDDFDAAIEGYEIDESEN
ncbi:MAG: DNA gyrase inhibitor YacG [Pseudomonadota bacterium]|nr:DNA gyrase inhibitor YacG [Pseudomonadota bacterium]